MYYFALIVCAPFALIFFKMKVSYEGGTKFKIPKGSIIISPHKTFLDAMLLSYLFFFNRIYYLVADWYKGFLKIFKPFMLLLGAVIVDINGQDYNFINSSQKILGRGKNLLVFPEGDYSSNKHLFEFGEFKTGYLLIALKTASPIVPVVTDFSYALFSRVHIKIGKPIYVELNHNRDSKTQEITFLNNLIKGRSLDLFYQIKKEKIEKLKIKYELKIVKSGDIIRVKSNNSYHYGLYIDENTVIDLNNVYNQIGKSSEIKYISLSMFAKNGEIEVRNKSKKTRSIKEIELYLKEIIHQQNYSLENCTCLDFINRLTLKVWREIKKYE